MKKKGFTLIELLAVIVILAIISLIATPIILGIVEDAKKGIFLRDCEMIEHAAELYVINELNGNVKSGDTIAVELLQKYAKNLSAENLNESVIVESRKEGFVHYYTGRDKNPYENYPSLKETIEKDSEHIVKNTVVNGQTVNKVIGTKSGKVDQKNYVWYSG